MSARLSKRIVCFYSDVDFGVTTHLVTTATVVGVLVGYPYQPRALLGSLELHDPLRVGSKVPQRIARRLTVPTRHIRRVAARDTRGRVRCPRG